MLCGGFEVIQSVFSNLQDVAEAAEAAAAESYVRFAAESNKDRAAEKIELGGAHQAAAEGKMQAGTADIRAAEDDLLAAERCTILREEPWTCC